ncbi:hypothetical protein ENSA5_37700 [Enhygromyxa salina]|uniref:Fibronectin type-III domain-containing protein n=1 Tax=Enhygromyxa salina TaxID=215803 RepID=A0A2S9XRZ6_9BACT|nr:hypothetical protein ENSA5_37700 [Enhygromyxa salina]
MALLFASALLFAAPELWAAPEPSPTPSAAAPTMVGDPELESSNGAVLLKWEPAESERELEYELQESSSANFDDPSSRYRGTLPSWYVSGRLDGRSYFRVRSRPLNGASDGGEAPWTEWSAAQSVLVEHHDLRLAVILFILGAVVFVITAATVLLAARSTSTPR